MQVDRRLAQVIAYKRIATGTAALVGGVVMSGLGMAHGGATPLVVLAVTIFFGGGAWALRDGLRLHRELRSTSSPRSAGRRAS
jgi:hypothetical protein